VTAKWNVGTKIGVGFALMLLLFVIVGAVSYRSTTQLAEAAELRKHTYEVLDSLNRIFSLLQDVQIGQRGFAITGDDSYLEPYEAAVSRIGDEIRAFRTLAVGNERQERVIDTLEPLIQNRLSVAQDVVNAVRTRGPAAGLEMIKEGTGNAQMNAIRAAVQALDAEEGELLRQREAAADSQAVNARVTVVLGTLIALLFSGLSSFGITRNIAGPLHDLTLVAERITVGDLSLPPSASERADEVGVLSRAFERMTHSLRDMAGVAEQIAAGDLRSTVRPQSPHDVLGNAFARMVDNLRDQTRLLVEGAGVLGSAANELVASSAQLAASAGQSATAVSEATTTVEEVRQTAQVASEKARYVADSAQRAAQISETGRKATENVSSGMNRIREQMAAIAASMVRLSEQNQAIGQIIATVEDLAAQSNLLAVNAAIEAAKAGEHGKGFGVVAQEVKSLAEQSRQATTEVRTILSDIQRATTTAALATEQGSKAVEAGARQSEAAGESIQALAGSVNEAAQAATQIAASSRQQLVGVDQVASAMESIKQVSTQNVGSAKQLETASRNLSDLGQRMNEIVARYTV
jgi:methyl-accepting chemotaxis protein